MFVVDGVIHYCVANMPGGVPVTSTMALTNATLPYVEAIADHGLTPRGRGRSGAREGSQRDRREGDLPRVAEAHGLDFTPLADALLLAG